MRTTSIMLAFAFSLVGPSLAGSVETSLPGAGVFAFQSAQMSGAALTTVASLR